MHMMYFVHNKELYTLRKIYNKSDYYDMFQGKVRICVAGLLLISFHFTVHFEFFVLVGCVFFITLPLITFYNSDRINFIIVVFLLVRQKVFPEIYPVVSFFL